MTTWRLLAAAVLAAGLLPGTGRAQEVESIFAIPSQTLTFATHYAAHDAGFFQKKGLKATDRYLVGVASNAVLAGSADFTMTTAVAFLRTAAQGQKLQARADLADKPLIELRHEAWRQRRQVRMGPPRSDMRGQWF